MSWVFDTSATAIVCDKQSFVKLAGDDLPIHITVGDPCGVRETWPRSTHLRTRDALRVIPASVNALAMSAADPRWNHPNTTS